MQPGSGVVGPVSHLTSNTVVMVRLYHTQPIIVSVVKNSEINLHDLIVIFIAFPTLFLVHLYENGWANLPIQYWGFFHLYVSGINNNCNSDM